MVGFLADYLALKEIVKLLQKKEPKKNHIDRLRREEKGIGKNNSALSTFIFF
jgi:hypothetical protein